MRRIRLRIAYDGTDFSGFQKLPGKRTVEGELNRALSEVCREDIAIIGASRTDSGVHALGNVAVFDTESSIPEQRFAMAVNTKLPDDIRVLSSESCGLSWHPRKQDCIKTYEYHIYNSRVMDPLKRRYSLYCPYRLDLDAMRAAMPFFTGRHDFTSFSNPASQVLLRGGSAVRCIYEMDLRCSGEILAEGRYGELVLSISGTGFLYHMVRIIAGTLIEVGTGARSPGSIGDILLSRDRRSAGMTAPACGLWLRSIDYEALRGHVQDAGTDTGRTDI